MAVTGADHRPRLDALQRWIVEGGTLGGARLLPEAQGLRVFREFRAVAELRVPVDACWDGRWQAPAAQGARTRQRSPPWDRMGCAS
jgi:tRNA(Ile)-lysidine synthase